jgi:hypothetical protein
MNPKHAFSHATAAELYQLPVPAYALGAGLHVAAPFPLRAPSGKGVIGHQVAQSLWARQDIVPEDYETDRLFAFTALTPELVWAQLAETLACDDLVAIGDAIVGGGHPIGTIAGLREMTHACTGRRGAHRMAAAVELVRVGSLSRPESLLRLIVVRAGIPEPALNLQVTDGLGRPISMADLCWPEFRVLVEYEGDGHRVSPGKFRSDITRGERYQDGGWFQLRASARDVFGDPNPFVGRLARRLRERGWRPGSRELRQVAGARA